MPKIHTDETFTIGAAPDADPVVAFVARQAVGTTRLNTLSRRPHPFRLEVEDAFFNLNSAVMMPDTVLGREPDSSQPFLAQDEAFMQRIRQFHPQTFLHFTIDPPTPGGGQDDHRVGGILVLAATYRFLARNPQFKLLIAGHTDTSGDDSFNFALSVKRAKNVLFLLQGERSQWVHSAIDHSQVEDQKRILRHVERTRAFGCDPGEVDNVSDHALSTAVARFQASFNARFQASLAVDGTVGKETWGAFFDLYMDDLAEVLKTIDIYSPSLRIVVSVFSDDQAAAVEVLAPRKLATEMPPLPSENLDEAVEALFAGVAAGALPGAEATGRIRAAYTGWVWGHRAIADEVRPRSPAFFAWVEAK
jgi:hypothetical protein